MVANLPSLKVYDSSCSNKSKHLCLILKSEKVIVGVHYSSYVARKIICNLLGKYFPFENNVNGNLSLFTPKFS